MGYLEIVFPQWQGAGTCSTLEEGALHAQQAAGLESAQRVALAAEPATARMDGVDHLEALLAQQQSCWRLLQQRQPERILTCGGDCGVEVAPLAYLNHRLQGRLNVVWLDAHGDLNTPASSPSGHFHGMPLRLLMGEGLSRMLPLVQTPLAPEQLILAGQRDLDVAEREWIDAKRLRLFGVEAMAENPGCVAAALNPAWPCYIHLDLDVLDPASHPWVCCPTPGGLALETLRQVIDAIVERVALAGAGVTECTAGRVEDAATAGALLRRLRSRLA
ncbi:arginase family protein [Chromobacterium alkanivorans]|uniref:arginase family protein n=1 Tax=Chromobacterium alkanivorans TaxID=1071719 RepID=UPI0019675FD7|nr:arginase family protein [Chromobacterium alkanivorans]MBN3004854.1 arginase family protein [Chromobacterium alkanivorans]